MNTTGTPPSAMEALERQFQTHLRLVRQNPTSMRNKDAQQKDEYKKAPLFSSAVAHQLGHLPSSQYGLLGEEVAASPFQSSEINTQNVANNLVYANHSEPWSAFICGLQGMGKSHSLAAMLENCLFESHQYGKAPKPLAAMAFHFDPYSSTFSTQYCELAYFCAAGIDVRVLVSPRNLKQMKTHYENLPGLSPDAKRPRVFPLKFSERQLNNASIKALMSFGGSTSQPLYMAVLNELLEKLSEKRQGVPGVDLEELKRQLRAQKFNADQKAMLDLRMQLLESFMASGKEVKSAEAIWNFEPSSLTIVDLSSESVNEAAACGLYSICLGLFMADRNRTGRVVVLDEAHKFLTATTDAHILTEDLIRLIRQQRHLGARVLIATQEPTLDTRLLDLCNVSIIHHFGSQTWFKALEKHLAGGSARAEDLQRIFDRIVALPRGSALVFSPTSLLHLRNNEPAGTTPPSPIRLGASYTQLEIRPRTTLDGGRSITSEDQIKVKDDGGKSDDCAGADGSTLDRSANSTSSEESTSEFKTGAVLSKARGQDLSDDPGAKQSSHVTTTDRQIEKELRSQVPKFWDVGKKRKVNGDMRTNFFNICDATVERLRLDKRFFMQGEWRAKSRMIVMDEMDRIEQRSRQHGSLLDLL